MLARAVRSGLTESYHDGAIAAVALSGELLLEIGEIDKPFFYRSAIKPFQATVLLEAGADLNREQTALAASSHRGQPVHGAIVEDLLAAHDLDVSMLQCPPDWPLSGSARLRLARSWSSRSPNITIVPESTPPFWWRAPSRAGHSTHTWSRIIPITSWLKSW